MLVYIDTDFKCYTRLAEGRTAVETPFFDGKCATFIEGYRLIPEGQTWTRSDGVTFRGEIIVPITEYRLLATAQQENNRIQPEIVTLAQAGASQVQARMTETGNAPEATTGIFVRGVSAWEPGKNYAKNDLFSYEGAMGYVKQAHTSQETWPPFTAGTEALYGARPAPDVDGVHQYVYNMAASVGMLVRDPDGTVYKCVQAINDMLYKPSQIPAHFEQV